MTDAPPISIVVPLTGGPAQAIRCFQGIAAQAGCPDYEVIVVDDASVGLEALLASLEGEVDVIRTGRRIGFAAAANLAAGRARGRVVVLVRDAAVPGPGWLASLVAAIDDPAVGLAASATEGAAETHAVAAWSVAVRTAELGVAGVPDVPAELAIGALALRLAERSLRVLTAPASKIAAPGARTGAARAAPGQPVELTVVIPTLDAASERVRGCVAAVQATTDVAHVIVIVDNGCPPQGFADPVNAGLRAARSPYVVVMNDDVEPLAGWWAPLRRTLDAGAAVAVPLTVDGGMRYDFPAWCFAMSSQSVADFSHAQDEFFDPALVVWYQDTDLLHRLRQAGNPPVVVEDSQIRHGLSQTVATEDPVLSTWIQAQVAADREQFIRKHPDAVLNRHGLAAA